MKPHKKTTKRVQNFLNEIGWLFGVNNMETRIKLKKANGEVAADVYVCFEYRQFHLGLYPTFFRLDRQEQLDALVHELCHVFTLPQKLNASNLRDGHLVTESEINITCENATSAIEQIMSGLLAGKMGYARDAYAKYLKGYRG